METNYRKRMYELGEWLEKFLNPNIRSWEYAELVSELIILYNIDFTIDSDLSLMAIELIYDQPTDVQTQILSFINNPRLFSESGIIDYIYDGPTDKEDNNFCIKEIEDCDLPIGKKKALKVILEIFFTLDQNEDSISWKGLEDWSFHTKEALFDFINIREPVIFILKKIKATKSLWSKTFNNELKKEAIEEGASAAYVGAPASLIYLKAQAMYETIIFRGDELEKVHTFDNQTSFYADYYGTPTLIPWGVLVSKALIDFFLFGGQEHFKFCENCGRFTIVKRKGKQFCSDVCRTEFNRTNIK